MSTTNFTWDPKKYDRISIPQQLDGQNLISLINPSVDWVVVDIGCGSGTLTMDIAKLVSEGKVIGIDASEDMLKSANEKRQSLGLKNVELRRSDFYDIDLFNVANLVFSSSALHWVKDQGRVLAKIYRTLMPGGEIALQIGARDSFKEGTEIACNIIQKLKLPEQFDNWLWPCVYPSIDEYERLLVEAGFIDYRIDKSVYSYMFKDSQEAVDFHNYSGMHAYLSNLTENEAKNFLDEMKEGFELLETEKGIPTSIRCLYVTGSKPQK